MAAMNVGKAGHGACPLSWGAQLSGPPCLEHRLTGRIPAIVRRWTEINPDIRQPALDRHFVSLHLGGPKRLYRRGEGCNQVRDIPKGAYSIVPAGTWFDWMTEGPVDFLHLYIECATLDTFIAENFDRDPRAVSLSDALGSTDALMAPLIATFAAEIDGLEPLRTYVEALLQLVIFRLLKLHSTVGQSAFRVPLALAPYRLRRAVEFIEATLGEDIGLADIAAAAGVSAFHFARGFKIATGKPPYAFLVDRRIAAAKVMLREADLPIGSIAGACGFASAAQFSRSFRRATGSTPSGWRSR